MSRQNCSFDHAEERSASFERAVFIHAFCRKRAKVFADLDFFGEPAFAILLDLYIAHHEGRKVTISDACNATDAPWTTALRRLNTLHDRGFIRRAADHLDRRRCYVTLAPRALLDLERLFM
jgi:DNA-binding MarR family transcriptional regulator